MVHANRSLRWPAVSAGAALVFLDAFLMLGSLLLAVMRCDEGCTDDPGAPWHQTIGAWQWDAFPILAGTALLASVAGVALALRGHRGASSAAYATSVAALLLWSAIYATA